MTQQEALAKHDETCEECRRVERGESPFCSARFVLEVLAGVPHKHEQKAA